MRQARISTLDVMSREQRNVRQNTTAFSSGGWLVSHIGMTSGMPPKSDIREFASLPLSRSLDSSFSGLLYLAKGSRLVIFISFNRINVGW